MKLNVTSILIIENHNSTANGYQNALEEAGYNVLTVPNILEATQALNGIGVDLIMLTYERENAEWVKKLRENEHYAHIPVVLTSHIHRQIEIVTRHNDVWFMEKPPRPQQIVAALEKMLEQFRAGD